MKKAKPATIEVRFRPNIKTDGTLCVVTIAQGDVELNLTRQQAETLAKQLATKFGFY